MSRGASKRVGLGVQGFVRARLSSTGSRHCGVCPLAVTNPGPAITRVQPTAMQYTDKQGYPEVQQGQPAAGHQTGQLRMGPVTDIRGCVPTCCTCPPPTPPPPPPPPFPGSCCLPGSCS